MGDGAVKRVGLSLAKKAFVFLLDRFAGKSLKNADFSLGFHPGFADISEMLLSFEPQLKLDSFRSQPLTL